MSEKKPNKKEMDIKRLADEFDLIQEESNSITNNFDISQHLATIDDLPDLGEISIYDYNADMISSSQKGIEVLQSLVDLYLGDFPELKNHKYIKNKLNEDAIVYAETLFLQKMTRKSFISQMRQVDNGDNGARMHEIVNQTVREIRENSKFASSQKSDLERYYKEFRSDLVDVVSNLKMSNSENGIGDEDGKIIDNSDLNDMVSKALLKNKKEGHQ